MNGPREGDAYQKRFSTVWTHGAGEAGSQDFKSLDMLWLYLQISGAAEAMR